MKKFIKAIYDTRKVMIAEPVIETNPVLATITLKGFIHLRAYSGSEPRFEGGEAKELRALLSSLAPEGFQVMVKTNPTMEWSKEATYEFNATKRCASQPELDKEVSELKNALMVRESIMPLTKPSQWVS